MDDRYIISDELDPNALRLGPAYNDLTAADTSATDTLLTGRQATAQGPAGLGSVLGRRYTACVATQ